MHRRPLDSSIARTLRFANVGRHQLLKPSNIHLLIAEVVADIFAFAGRAPT